MKAPYNAMLMQIGDIDKFENLGWQNGWTEAGPAKYILCRLEKHQLDSVHDWERCKQLTFCKECKIFWQTDSS